MSKNKSLAVVAAYEDLLSSLSHALSAHSYENFPERNLQVQRALNILNELFSALDFDKGGEVAENLGFVYCYILYSLGRVKTHDDTKPLHDAIRLLSPLYSSWKQLKLQAMGGADHIHSSREELKKRAAGQPN